MLSLSGLYEFFETLGRRGQWVGFLVGIVAGISLGAWVCWFLCRQFMPSAWRAKYESLREDHDTLKHDHQLVSARLDETTSHLDSIQKLNLSHLGQIEAGEKTREKISAERDRFHHDLAVTNARLEHAEMKGVELERARETLEGKFTTWIKSSVRKRWDQPVVGPVPQFRQLHSRKMPIISVINLKGGVGKTTITANLGVTLAARGHRVLMIDLDYQGSLTKCCLSKGELESARKGRRYVNEILKDGEADRATSIFRNVIRLEDLGVGPAYVLPTDEDRLDELENQVMAHWLMGQSTDDVRFRLREALHDPAISKEYDVVLLDCPPRLSTGCVNGLAASDYVLIPLMPEKLSTEATPRLLRWLRNFQGTFCPELTVLGVVANRVKFHMGKLTQEQNDIWRSIKDSCHLAWGSPVRFFDEAMVPSFKRFPHRIAAMSPVGRPTFDDLARVIIKEMPPYASFGSPAVHPVAHPSG